MAENQGQGQQRRMSREEQQEARKREAVKHSGLMKAAFGRETETTVAAAVIYEDGQGRELPLPESAAAATETKVVTSFAPEAVYRDGRGKVVVVDPANFMRPAGNYAQGGFGPEQTLCAESNLAQVLEGLNELYFRKNKDYRVGQLFTDRALYLPDVVFSRHGSVRKADVIALAEPVRGFALENHRSEREVDNAIRNRIETLLRIAAANGADTLVVGPFGCGRNGYDPRQVVALFAQWFEEHPGAIPLVVFSVSRQYFDVFNDAFGGAAEEHPVVVEAGDEESEDEEWRSVDLPEGVSIR